MVEWIPLSSKYLASVLGSIGGRTSCRPAIIVGKENIEPGSVVKAKQTIATISRQGDALYETPNALIAFGSPKDHSRISS